MVLFVIQYSLDLTRFINCSCFIFYSVAAPLIEKDNILRVMQNACLVLHVYCEKLKKNSFWKPYLGILYTEQKKSCVL